MWIEIVPCLQDNYAYLLSSGGDEVVVVDACEAAPIQSALGRRRVVAILSTHHHHDHVGGNAELLRLFPAARIYGHSDEQTRGRRIPGQTHGLFDDESFELLTWQGLALHIPGHTLTAVAYYFPAAGALFTGDTLFSAGCGRLFEGTAAQMHASLTRLMALPADTHVYFGHEYTEKNLLFAAAAEPANADITARLQAVRAQRAALKPSAPSTLADEAATNPFVRTAEPGVKAQAAQRPAVEHAELDDVEVFARLRTWKNSF